VSAYRSRGITRHVILNFKYGKQIHLRHLVAKWLIAAFDDPRLRDRRFDAIVPVPLHPARQRERGFNQAGLLAERLEPHLGVSVRPVLSAFVLPRRRPRSTGLSASKFARCISFTKKGRRAKLAGAPDR